jgi:hypothetical protein
MTIEFSLAHLTVLDSSPTEMIEIAHFAGYDYDDKRLIKKEHKSSLR